MIHFDKIFPVGENDKQDTSIGILWIFYVTIHNCYVLVVSVIYIVRVNLKAWNEHFCPLWNKFGDNHELEKNWKNHDMNYNLDIYQSLCSNKGNYWVILKE